MTEREEAKMTTAIDPQSHGRKLVRALALCLLALAATFAQSREARAQWTTSGTNTTTTNNVGVGTAAPTAKLETVDSNLNGVAAKFVQTNPTQSNGVVIQTQTGSPGDAALTVMSNAGATFGLVVRNTGNVGIGSTNPGKALVVQNDAANNHLSIVRPATNAAMLNIGIDNTGPFIESVTANKPISFYTHNGAAIAERVRITKDGNVGIGTLAPSTKLHVADSLPNGSAARFIQTNPTASNGVVIQTQTASEHDLALYVLSNGGATAGLAVRNSGNVGIGTGSPTARLHVAGDIRVDGNINAKYQDVAEWVPTTQKLAAGTVVVLDTAELNHVRESGRAYDTGVAGVISARPGIALGDGGEGRVLVATTGRVKVKVDATRGPINVGDLLVTSDVAGVAMKSQPLELGGVPIHRPGTIIGKALEPLAKGAGEILVLLSLQ
jgi:hypothetical protein